METFSSMTMTALDRTLVAGDAGRVTGERQERPDPEVPGKGRRRTFTAQCKQQVLAACEAAPDGGKGAILRREGLYSSLITECSKIALASSTRVLHRCRFSSSTCMRPRTTPRPRCRKDRRPCRATAAALRSSPGR
jgi:hypothetical protein